MNLPNLLTSLRLVLVFVLWVIVFVDRVWFVVLLLIAGLTDVFDGYFARRLGQVTSFGAKYDSIVDNFLGVSLLVWTYWLAPEILWENLVIVLVAVGLMILSWLYAVVKYKRNPEFHLYSNKVLFVVAFWFLLHAFLFGYNVVLLYVLCVGIILMAIEEMVIIYTHDDIDENIKSIIKIK